VLYYQGYVDYAVLYYQGYVDYAVLYYQGYVLYFCQIMLLEVRWNNIIKIKTTLNTNLYLWMNYMFNITVTLT